MADADFYGSLRQLAEELRGIRRELDELANAAAHSAATDPSKSLRASQQSLAQSLTDNGPEIVRLVELLRREVEENPGIRDYWGDVVTRVQIGWNDVQHDLVSLATGDHPTGSAIDATSVALNRTVVEICFVTVPPRLNQYLANYRNGQILRFDTTFKDELCRPEDIKTVIEYLYDQPLCVHGIVDPEHNTVTKVTANAARRAVTFVMFVIIIAFFLTLGFWVRNIPGVKDWFKPKSDLSNEQFAGGMLLVYLGGLAHVGISALKQIRQSATTDSRRFTSIGNWGVWAVAHELDLVASLTVLGILGAVIIGGQGTTDNLTLIAVGYSADSIADVFLGKFQTTVDKRTEVVAKSAAAIAI